MTLEKTLVQDVHHSLGRCFLNTGFLEKFYDNFIGINPAVPPYFAKTDMVKQRKLLKDGLTYLVMSAGGSPFALKEISKLGLSHDVKHLNIPPKLYTYWVDALVKTVRAFDAEMTPELEKKWLQVVDVGIGLMKGAHAAKASA